VSVIKQPGPEADNHERHSTKMKDKKIIIIIIIIIIINNVGLKICAIAIQGCLSILNHSFHIF